MTGSAHADRPDGPLLSVEGLNVEFAIGGGRVVHAASDVSFDIAHGETLGLVGESGSGKSSIARAIFQAPRPTSGSVRLGEVELTALRGRHLRAQRDHFQLIYQDPASSLNPRRTVAGIVAEPLDIRGMAGGPARDELVGNALASVGLDYEQVGGRRPHELSGGQCQRVNIARALIVRPRLLVCDEPVAALDVSVQAQILNLLADTRGTFGLSMLFISHDLAVIRHVSDRVAVIYLGRIVELGPPEEVLAAPAHHYTAALAASMPGSPGADAPPGSRELKGEAPSPVNPPSGCRFRTRCPRAAQVCATEVPRLVEFKRDHWVACHHPVSEAAGGQARPGPGA